MHSFTATGDHHYNPRKGIVLVFLSYGCKHAERSWNRSIGLPPPRIRKCDASEKKSRHSTLTRIPVTCRNLDRGGDLSGGDEDDEDDDAHSKFERCCFCCCFTENTTDRFLIEISLSLSFSLILVSSMGIFYSIFL